MTPRQRVLRTWPLAACIRFGRRYMVYISPNYGISLGAGGFSAKQAWENARK